jgi:cell division protein DivIC
MNWKVTMLKFIKNKFLVTIVVFTVYALFLDDWDIFHLIKQNRKLTELTTQKIETKKKLTLAKASLAKLKTPAGIEAFAREEKFFKKNDEDIFVISYE